VTKGVVSDSLLYDAIRSVSAALNVKRWTPHSKVEDRDVAGQPPRPVAELALDRLGLRLLALPRRVVAVLKGKRWERRWLAPAEGLVERRQLGGEHHTRVPVENDVVVRVGQDVLVVRQLDQPDPREGPGLEGHGRLALPVHEPAGLGVAVLRRKARDVLESDIADHVGMHHGARLDRAGERGSQYLMAAEDLRHRPPEGIDIERASQPARERDRAAHGAFDQLLGRPHPLLNQ
jgi:hypothetical protein